MILGRSSALWVALLAAALNVLVVVFNVPLDAIQVGALNTLGLVVIGLMANAADPAALPVLAPTTSDRRAPADPAGTPGVGRRSADPAAVEPAAPEPPAPPPPGQG